jgi:hypothetical protein
MTLDPTKYQWRIIQEMIKLMIEANVNADTHSQAINDALALMLVDRMQEIGQKGCYICDGFGHTQDVCPTAVIVRNIAQQATFPKLKSCVTTSIGVMRTKGFLKVMNNQTDP